MYIRSREDALENLAEILDLPDRRDQIVRGIAQHPLSVQSFQSWSSGLGTDGQVLRRADEWQVSYGAGNQADGGELRSVTLRVLPEDWPPCRTPMPVQPLLPAPYSARVQPSVPKLPDGLPPLETPTREPVEPDSSTSCL